ncbi:hypothetical protein FVEG_17343 [Fusarium verticillioides 7600]|uniref:Uncharacterized protein n=1 Tax=Gibberella moniliformis (strain M3125 / FGSC 7600) TaxID=334819 RepID=W7NE76_GIBM7|nr:hypothetical protein FVEG_17343 [Fusarium verticillioides 7600]EWG54612.1 hypothetical protein FVEG_17343 [Fusarium verticillioides 7600]
MRPQTHSFTADFPLSPARNASITPSTTVVLSSAPHTRHSPLMQAMFESEIQLYPAGQLVCHQPGLAPALPRDKENHRQLRPGSSSISSQTTTGRSKSSLYNCKATLEEPAVTDCEHTRTSLDAVTSYNINILTNEQPHTSDDTSMF